jgi:hypothetical protein
MALQMAGKTESHLSTVRLQDSCLLVTTGVYTTVRLQDSCLLVTTGVHTTSRWFLNIQSSGISNLLQLLFLAIKKDKGVREY